MIGMPWTERLRLVLRRAQSWLLCRAGRHLWVQRTQPEVGGARAVYHLCRRCGRERSVWEPRSYGTVGR